MGLLETILVIILIVWLIGSLPQWPHARNWGYNPSGWALAILLIVLLLWFAGVRLPG